MTLSPFDKANIGTIIAGEGEWFSAQLLRLIARADRPNRERLRTAFPEEVAAWEEWYGAAEPA
jgi:hypothetical protein